MHCSHTDSLISTCQACIQKILPFKPFKKHREDFGKNGSERRLNVACPLRDFARRLASLSLAAIICSSLCLPSAALSGRWLGLGGTSAAYASEGAADTPQPDDPPASTLVDIPAVLDVSVPNAVETLQNAGFRVAVVGDSTETSYVTQQNPTGQAEAGSLITVTGVETKTSEPDPGDDPTLMEMTLLGYSTNSFSDWVSEMNRTYLGGTGYRLNNGITEKGGKVRLMVEATWSDSKIFKQSDSGWRNVDGQIVWTSSATSVATVDSTGVVTAVGDGETVITATAPNGVTATMSMTIVGQSGAYVTGAHVVDESGEPYGTSYIVIEDISTGSRTFYVRLTYSDGTTACNAPGASDYSAEGSASIASCCTWSITSSDVGYVNPSSGNFIPSQDGRSQVIVTATGGNPNVANGLVTASVSINVNTGKYKDGKAPSSQLTVKVEYEQMPGVVGKEETYSIGELQGIQNVTCTYSLTKSGGLYVTDTASGIYLSTLLEHMGIATSDVLYFQFAANDGANPGKITNSFLFGYARYYFPLANAASTNGQVAVAPMLAYADSWKEGGTCEPNTELNSGTCLRLLFGSTGLADDSTSKSLKYINTMTIVLDGAPPTDWGNKTKPDGEDKTIGGGRYQDRRRYRQWRRIRSQLWARVGQGLGGKRRRGYW